MRAAAISPTKAIELKNSYGNSILASRGLLAWAISCANLQATMPAPKPVANNMPRRSANLDADYQLKNILTQMALRLVEGV